MKNAKLKIQNGRHRTGSGFDFAFLIFNF